MTERLTRFDRKFYAELCIFASIVLCYVLLSSPHLFDPNFFAPDADRIAMDGIFLKDFVSDIPGSLLHPYEYTTTYYAKYPALSVGYRPIFFQSMEAISYMILGPSYVSGKITVLCFLFTGMFFWLRLVKRTHGYNYAIGALLLWVTNPNIYLYSQETMLEIPTLSMVIISVYFIYKYFDNITAKNAVFMGLFMGLTLWTNQKSAFILLILLFYPVFSGNWKKLFRRESFIAYLILCIFLVPLALITFWLGAQNFAQSVGAGTKATKIINFKELIENIQFLYEYHFTPLPLCLIGIGVIHCLYRKRKNSLIYLVSILSIYVFFTYIKHDIPRYSMYWIPFFCFFGAHTIIVSTLAISNLTNQKKRVIACALFGLPVCLQVFSFSKVFIPTASGYGKAAEFVIENSKSPIVLFDGYLNGQFIYFLRIIDKEREFVVLRGDKLISSSSISYKNQLKIHLNNEEEIKKSLVKMGVHLVVVESKNLSKLDIYDRFRRMLSEDPQFKKLKSIKVESNRKELVNTKLLIYENLSWTGLNSDSVIKLRLPVVGQELSLPLKRVLQK